MRLSLVLFTLIALLASNNLQANNKENTKITNTPNKVGIVVKIYALESNLSDNNFTEIITNNQPEYTPGLVIEAGKTGGIAIINPEKYDEIDGLNITFNLDDTAKKYSVDFKLYQGEASSIADMSDLDVGRDLVFSAELNGAPKLIQVKTVVMEGSLSQMLAKNLLAIKPSPYIYEEAQQYFQEDKIWDQNLRRYRDLKNKAYYRTRSNRLGSDFFYLTNHDSKRLIKGTLKVKGVNKKYRTNNGSFYGRVQYTGLHNFSFADDLLNFVILPNQSVLLGHWPKAMQLEIVDADFLSAEETTKLRAEYDKNNKG